MVEYFPAARRIENRKWVHSMSVRKLIKDTATQWLAHKDARQGAALAYYSIFSLGPVIVIAIAVAGLVFGQEAARGEVSSALSGILGESGALAVNAMLLGASKPHEGILATVIGVGTLLFAAIGVVVQLKDAFNTVWEVDNSHKSGVWAFIRTYALSLAGVLAVGFLLLISMLMTAALAAVGKYFTAYLSVAPLQLVGFFLSLGIISLLFAMMFKLLPDTSVAWSDVWLGAIITGVLFELGKLAIGLYIGQQGLESTYGAAASIVVVLIWVYYSSQIVLMGAEFTNVYAHRYGSLRLPRDPEEVFGRSS